MKKQGFTILEILVVLTVLSILIGIGVPRIKGMQDQANITKVKSELKTIQVALEAYYMNQTPNAYPDSSSGDPYIFQLTKTVLVFQSPQMVPGVMFDPFGWTSSSEYFYKRSSSGDYYVIGSLGMNIKVTEADIRDNFVIKDQGPLSDAALSMVAEGVICVTNGSGC